MDLEPGSGRPEKKGGSDNGGGIWEGQEGRAPQLWGRSSRFPGSFVLGAFPWSLCFHYILLGGCDCVAIGWFTAQLRGLGAFLLCWGEQLDKKLGFWGGYSVLGCAAAYLRNPLKAFRGGDLIAETGREGLIWFVGFAWLLECIIYYGSELDQGKY